MRDIIVTGDIHADFGKLNELINKKKPKIVICCGDFGYWPRFPWFNENVIKTQGAKIYWCDGNHEDHWSLAQRESNEILPDVFYMSRGSTLVLPDGRTAMFMGGAESIDKNVRTEGLDWFREEIITQKDLYDLPDVKVDIFITHTCPVELVHDLTQFYPEKGIEPSNYALSELRKKYKPDLWFFGHWHVYREGILFGTKWHCLSYPRQGERWWMYLPD